NNHLAYLATHESAGHIRPTDQGVAFQEEVSAQIDAELDKLESVWQEYLPQINQMIRESGVELIVPLSSKRKKVRP
ncbi:MAG: hypothetical protein R3330_18970, partial [Saprospiraceae bacterium]|nr:hypothetical protein [Saprospiraceae bacterium]